MLSQDEKDSILRRLRRGNAILFNTDSELLAPLMYDLRNLGKRGIILWAFDGADQAVSRFEQLYADETVPRGTLMMSRAWAQGTVKMPQVRPLILSCHALARSMDSREGVSLVHAIAQACSAVHAKNHAVAFLFYRLTALIHQNGKEGSWEVIESMVEQLEERLGFWCSRAEKEHLSWAAFLPAKDRVKGKKQCL